MVLDTREPQSMKRTACRYAVVWCFLAIVLVVVLPASAAGYVFDAKNMTGSLQDLINSTSDGDSILLDGGIYAGNIIIDRSITLAGRDRTNPPKIVSGDGNAGITLRTDGIRLDSIKITGSARNGIAVQSKNNRITNITVDGMNQGIGLVSASENEIEHNTLLNNTLGLEVDRSSHANAIYLNHFDNTVNAISQSDDNIWYSVPWDYQYSGMQYTGALGNYWSNYAGRDTDGNGVGEIPYVIQVSGLPHATAGGITDDAPLVSPPGSYLLVQPANETVPADGRVQPKENFNQRSPGENQPGQQVPPGPFPPILLQFWWVIAGIIIISVIAGIWFERIHRAGKGTSGHESTDTIPPLPNATIVTKPPAALDGNISVHRHYGASLPPALEKKYPGAEYVAEGGVSRVFHAWDEKEGRDIAVKVPIRFDEVTGTQFTKELNVWQGLHHKNIVGIYAANIFPMPYIEMEYIRSSLADMQFPLDIRTAVTIIRGVAEGLRYAHEQGIVHRDIKPENVLIAPDSTPKITDWGLSKAEGTKQSGIIGFSLDYAAPEQLAPNIYGEPGPWTDIYQLGVLFYEMVTGQVPYTGGGMGEVTHAILHDEPSEPGLTGPSAERIRQIIRRCMQKRPEDRYRSVNDILADLEKIAL